MYNTLSKTQTKKEFSLRRGGGRKRGLMYKTLAKRSLTWKAMHINDFHSERGTVQPGPKDGS